MKLIILLLCLTFVEAIPRWERTKLALQTAGTLGLYWPYKLRSIAKNCDRVNLIGLMDGTTRQLNLVKENCQYEFGCTQTNGRCVAAPFFKLFRQFRQDVLAFCARSQETCTEHPVCYQKKDRCEGNVAYALRRAEKGLIGITKAPVVEIPSVYAKRTDLGQMVTIHLRRCIIHIFMIL